MATTRANPVYWDWWSADNRGYVHRDYAGHGDVIYIEPHGRGNTQYLGMGDTDVLRCLSEAKRLFAVDEDRVYLTGDSMGGWGTWNVATRHPDLFAAIAPVFGGVDYHSELTEEQLAALDPVERFWQDKRSSWSMADSLINMPVYVHHGDADAAVNVEWSRYGVRMLQRWGYDVRYQRISRQGARGAGARRQCRAEHSLVPGTSPRSESAQGAHPLGRVAQRHCLLDSRAAGCESAGVHGRGRGSRGPQRDPARHPQRAGHRAVTQGRPRRHGEAGEGGLERRAARVRGIAGRAAAHGFRLQARETAQDGGAAGRRPGFLRDAVRRGDRHYREGSGDERADPQACAVLHRQLDRLAEVLPARVHRHRDERGRHGAVFAAAVRRARRRTR